MTDGDAPLQIRLLGGLHLRRNGHDVALPASKKTRALLGYLIATEQPHRRERLCDLLWDGPDDPRAELRWSVSKLRPLLNTATATLLVSDRERVGFTPEDADIDLMAVRALIGDGIATAPTARLRAAAALFRGELLDGLDLPVCYRYQEWCATEREAASRQHRAILAALVTRLEDHPEAALPYARALAAADPLAEPSQAMIIRLLDRLGRKREALAHFERVRQLLATELGVTPGDELTAAGRNPRSVPTPPPPSPAADHPRPERPPARLMIGRHDERQLIDRAVAEIIAKRASPIVLVTGEPGIGKSHLLAYLDTRVTAAGGLAHGARAFEAEAARPYGIWIDLLRPIIQQRPRDQVPRDLGLLLPELGAPAGESGDRTRLFDAVVDLVRQIVAERALAIILDDVQWLDVASCALLHYLARRAREAPSRLLLAVAARAGEIGDNAAAAGVVRALRDSGRLHDIELTVLSAAETAQLVQSVAPRLDPGRIVAESDGNPLFAIELARAARRGDTGAGRTIERVVAGQLGRLRDDTRELLGWAAALERSFNPDQLARIAGRDVSALNACLAELERHGLIRPAGDESYDFGHDLIRQATYQSISQPRRTLMHRQIARVLMAATDGPLAGDAAHHAALGNDHELAARACIAAGERALRLFADVEASGFAERGARHVEWLPAGPLKVETAIALLSIRVHAATGPGMRRLPPIAPEVAAMTAAAEAFGLHGPAATGHYLLSVLFQEAGDRPQAERSTLRAARAGRISDDETQVHQLANTARCLLELETQIPRARALVAEAESLAGPLGIERCELHWARGLLQRWDGEPAAAAIGRALTLARHTEDWRRQYKCLTWLAVVAFEREQFAETRARCTELIALAKKSGEEDTPFVMTLQALAKLRAGATAASAPIDLALHQLRTVDDKSYLAYALNATADLKLRAGELAAVRGHARAALTAASLMHRQNDMAIAWTLLASIGDDEAMPELRRLVSELADRDRLSARARSAVRSAARRDIPTPASTLPHHR